MMDSKPWSAPEVHACLELLRGAHQYHAYIDFRLVADSEPGETPRTEGIVFALEAAGADARGQEVMLELISMLAQWKQRFFREDGSARLAAALEDSAGVLQ